MSLYPKFLFIEKQNKVTVPVRPKDAASSLFPKNIPKKSVNGPNGSFLCFCNITDLGSQGLHRYKGRSWMIFPNIRDLICRLTYAYMPFVFVKGKQKKLTF